MVEEVLFSGTTQNYHNEMIRKFGVFRHDGSFPVHLTEHTELAREYAEARAEQWKDNPAILVVYRSRTSGIGYKEGDIHPTCALLQREWYDFVPAKVAEKER